MERVFSPLIRQFSAIEGLQTPYTLVYALEQGTDGDKCRLTLCRTGAQACAESLQLTEAPEHAYRLLRYLCENVVQPEIWRDVVAEAAAQLAQAERIEAGCEG